MTSGFGRRLSHADEDRLIAELERIAGVSIDDVSIPAADLVEGWSLEKALSNGIPQDRRVAISILSQVAGALDYAHGEGIVHRDVKPANILMRPDGKVKITDFGIARISSQTVTKTGFSMGTPAYMAPEQIMSARVNGRADQFSLAVIAYQMLSGRRPFVADTHPALIFKIVSEEVQSLHELDHSFSPRTSEVLRKGLAKDPDQRYTTCAEFIADLSESLEGRKAAVLVAASSPDPKARIATQASANRAPAWFPVWAIALIAGVLATVILLAVFGVFKREAPRPVEVANSQAATASVSHAAEKHSDKSAAIPRLPVEAAASPREAPAAALPPVVKSGPHVGDSKVNPRDGLKYMWIPPRTFMMGCSPGDGECFEQEKPPHEVIITRGFWLGQTAVTQAAYQRVTGSNPSHFKGDNLPVESVNWDEARSYCQAIGGRLPTEVEWEHAARAGSTAASYGNLDETAWYLSNSGGKTHEVGQKLPNAFGLYDMLGNVWQWTADWYGEKYYQASQRQDPSGPADGAQRVLRGGSWGASPRGVRVSNRGKRVPGDRYYTNGLRCVGE